MAARFKENPELEKNFLERQEDFIDQVSKIIGCDGTNEVAVPLAFHFTNSFDCSDESCMLSAIYDNIAILNASFGNVTTSPNAANCPAAYPAISDGTCVSFYLAEPPACADPTTTACNAAITVGEFNNGGYANSNNGGAGACWDDYLNVFIISGSGGLLGVADQIPDALPASGPGEGVTVGAPYFGGLSASCNPFDTNNQYGQGKTLIHEIGHYLGLFHVFQGGCNDEPNNSFSGTNIRVNDTPAQNTDSTNFCGSGCSNSGCGGGTFRQTANIMDYTDDACMDMFSEDQAFAMNVVANGLFANISIPAAASNITDLFGLCPAGACALICPSQVITPLTVVDNFCTDSPAFTLSEAGVVVDEASDAVYVWSTGDYLSNGGTPLASTNVPAMSTPDCTISTMVYYLNVNCGTSPLLFPLEGGTHTVNIYPSPPMDLSTLVTISGENTCSEPTVTAIPGCTGYVTITPVSSNPTFPVANGNSGISSYTLDFVPDPLGPDCCLVANNLNLVTNGDFEGGSASWTIIENAPRNVADPTPDGVIGISGGIVNGSSDAWLGGKGIRVGAPSVGSSRTSIEQTVTLDATCTGADLSFDYSVHCNANATFIFEVTLGGVLLGTLDCTSGSGTFSVDVIASGAPGGSSILFLEAVETDPNPRVNMDHGSIYIDNVSIVSTGCPSSACQLIVDTNFSCVCPNCHSNLTHGGACDLQTVESGVADYESSDWISTTQATVIQASAQVDYDAVDYVELNNDFEVKKGATFHAFIDGCGGAQIQASEVSNE